MPRQHRAWDVMPRHLRDEVYAIGAGRGHRMGSMWMAAIASAASLAAVWLEDGRWAGKSPLLPAPVEHGQVADAVDVRWTQHPAEEHTHRQLIADAGSTRTAVLVASATRYREADGDLLVLMRDTPGRLTPGPLLPTEAELLGLFGRCPDGCPVRASDHLPCWAQRLLSSCAQ